MKRWKVYMVVGTIILVIGCISGCANKKNEKESIKVVAEVQEAEEERRVEENSFQLVAKNQAHDESGNRKEESSEKQEHIEMKPVEKTADKGLKQVFASEKKRNNTKEMQLKSKYEEEKRNILVPELMEESSEQSVHTHIWEEQTKIIHHDAITEVLWIEDSPAWEEEVPIYTQKEQAVCVTCGMEIEGNPNEHLNDVCRQWKNVIKEVQVETQILPHEAEGHKEEKIIQEAYDETISNVICKECGAVK